MSELFYEVRSSVLYSAFDSFYASIEQFDKPKWQNQPLVVANSSNETAIAVGVSREAADYGIGVGMKVSDARSIYPPVNITPARNKRYTDVQRVINRKAETIFGTIRIFNLSEFAVDLEADAGVDLCIELSNHFKDFLVDEFGDILQVSIGVAANDFLAKLAAQMAGPDGFLFLDAERLDDVLGLELTDLPGIGPKIADRLKQLDIKTLPDLAAASPGELKRAWGSIRGEHFYHMLRGSREYDIGRPIPDTERRLTSSRVIPEMLSSDPEEARAFCRKMLSEGLQKARDLNSAAGKLRLEVVYRGIENPKIEWAYNETVRLEVASNAEAAWLKAIRPVLERLPERESLRPAAVSLIFSDLMILPEKNDPDFGRIPRSLPRPDRLEQIRNLFIKPGPAARRKGPENFEQYGRLGAVSRAVEPALAKISPEVLGWVSAKYGWNPENFAARLLPLQLEALNFGLFDEHRNKSGLVSAPTSAGKTLIAEIRMIQRFLDRSGARKKTVMLVPTREIGRERWQNFERGYGTIKGRGGRSGLKVAYSDGDLHQFDNDIWETNFDVAILVNEKFRFFVQNPKFLLDIGEVVVDEIAFLSDSVRGAFLESAIMSIVSHPERPSVLGLTHPTDDLKRILELLVTAKEKPFLLESDLRPIPIESGIWSPTAQKAEFINSNTGAVRFEAIAFDYPYSLVQTLTQLLKRYLDFENHDGETNNLVIAVPTKRMAIDIARLIASLIETDGEVSELVARNKSTTLVSNRLKGLDPSRIQTLLARLLPIGIGIHTADLSLYERRIVSQAFRESEIPILVCTSTMAHGVNLPAQSIVFLNWGLRRANNFPATDGIPFYETLKKDFIPWIGRVGRVGQPRIRPAESLYLCQKGEESEEFAEIERVIKQQKVHIGSTIFDSFNLPELVLFAVNTLFHRFDKDVPGSAVLEFFRVSVADRTNQEKIQTILDNFACPVEQPADGSETAGNRQEAAGVSDPFSESEPPGAAAADSLAEREMYPLNVYGDEEKIYHITLLGRIAAAHGVNPETCRILRAYLHERTADGASQCSRPLDILDIFTIVLNTPDGKRLRTISVRRGREKEVEDRYRRIIEDICADKAPEEMNEHPFFRRPPRSIHTKATLVALRYWSKGTNLLSIEEKFGFVEADANVQEIARDFARLIRLFGMLAQTQPGKPKTRPEKSEIDPGRIYPEFDLEEIAETVLWGLPVSAAPLARLGVDSLSRAWIMRLKKAVEATSESADLPLGERLRTIAEENEPFIFENLPTKGLAVRVSDALKNMARQPVGTLLRNDPGLARTFYANPVVAHAHVLQGKGRFTALKVMTRAGFSVFRRNERRGKPIELRDTGDFGYWADQRAVEFLAEIGFSPDSQEYQTDRFLIDLDPRDDFPFEKLKEVAREVFRRLRRHPWVDERKTYLNWTGGKGFHLVGEFPDGVTHGVEAVKLEIDAVVASMCDDETIFPKPLTSVYQPHVVLDVSPVMRRGVYRNCFSFHSAAGGICVPLSPTALDQFDPARHATPDFVIEIMSSMRPDHGDFYSLAEEFTGLLKERIGKIAQ